MDLQADRPDLIIYPEDADLHRCEDIFAESEPWIERHFKFAEATRDYGAYERAFKNICCNVSFPRFRIAYLCRGIAERGNEETYRIVGLDDALRSYYEFRFGAVPGTFIRAPRVGGLLLNATLAISFALFTVFWIACRMRIAPTRESVLLGSDFAADPRDTCFWREIAEDDLSRVLVVFRNRAQRTAHEKSIFPWRPASVADGVFSFAEGFAAMGGTVRDAAKILAAGIGLPTDYFRVLIAQTYHRAAYRALFRRFACRFFWGRDDYNTQHIIRSQELRRAGGVSLGIMHGIPAIASILHQLRYLDFDRYFIWGMDQYERFYRPTWLEDMKVIPVGSAGYSRDDLARLGPPTCNDVLCTLGYGFFTEPTLAAFREMATALPDRTFHVHIKLKEWPRPFMDLLERAFVDAPPNFVWDKGQVYDLIPRCRYVFTTGSTVTAEAVQFDRAGFVLDMDKRYKSLSYRNFPGICVHSPAEAVARIRAIENGTWRYPRETYGKLIDLSGRIIWDVIRAEIGLPPLGDKRAAASVRHTDTPVAMQGKRRA